MIKQIQLRGISRTPSDRMSEDGGLSESLNMYLDTAENAPAFVPEDVTEKLGLPQDLNVERIFIHKTANYENYIVVQEGRVVAYTPGVEDEEPLLVLELAGGERVNDIASVGNTLVVSTTTDLRYVLYKDKRYIDLGPFPSIGVSVVASDVISFSSSTLGSSYPTHYTSFHTDKLLILNTAPPFYKINEADSMEIIAGIYDKYMEMLSHNLELGVFSNPVFVIYAIRLYDGSLKYVSEPIMLGGKTHNGSYPYILPDFPVVFTYTRDPNAESDYKTKCDARVTNPYAIGVYLNPQQNIEQWKDVVASIDLFICPVYDVIPDGKRYARFGTSWDGGTPHDKTIILDPTHTESEEGRLEILLSSSVYRKVKSWKISDIKSNLESPEIIRGDFRGEVLELKESLYSNTIAGQEIYARKLDTYNNRTLAFDGSSQQQMGITFLNGQHASESTKPMEYAFEFYLDGDNQIISTRNELGGLFVSPNKSFYLGTQASGSVGGSALLSNYCAPHSWISFPSHACSKVKIYKKDGNSIKEAEVKMKAHPLTPNCSYAFLGYNKSLESLFGTEESTGPTLHSSIEQSRNNMLMVSKSDNPFIFPNESLYTFQSKVIGVAVATTALSQGQFGQFPLYVFTEDGIWAMETGTDGSFVSQKSLSREVCINPDSITSIDNAVVFVTAKGVMMLQGSQVINISPYMNGRHYTPNDSAKNLIRNQEGFDTLIEPISDEDPFMSFMKDAKVAYDYTGQRLIFISPANRGFEYVYKIDTQTWHKVAFEGFDLGAPLNSYPECLVQAVRYGQYIVPNPPNPDFKEEWAEQAMDLVREGWQDGITIPDIFTPKNFYKFIIGESGAIEVKGDADALLEAFDRQGFACKIYKKATQILSLSTVLDASTNQDTAKGILITRPFDLGMPDVYKSITNIKIRGDFDKGNVKYILQGSNDGRAFYTLNTLRGKSWRMFRIFILADLEPTERISWIDVDFEPRYQNKLR